MENGTKIQKSLTKIKEEQARLNREVREKTIGYIVTALGLVAGLAWNDAIKSAIEYIFPLDSSSVTAKLIYAFLITIVIALISAYLIKISEYIGTRKEKSKE